MLRDNCPGLHYSVIMVDVLNLNKDICKQLAQNRLFIFNETRPDDWQICKDFTQIRQTVSLWSVKLALSLFFNKGKAIKSL